MHTLQTAHFSRTYLGRYWPRFAMGVLPRFSFLGVSNGLFMGSVYTIANRLVIPPAVQ